MKVEFSKDTYSITKEQSQTILAILGEMPLKNAIHLNNYFINILAEQEKVIQPDKIDNTQAN